MGLHLKEPFFKSTLQFYFVIYQEMCPYSNYDCLQVPHLQRTMNIFIKIGSEVFAHVGVTDVGLQSYPPMF